MTGQFVAESTQRVGLVLARATETLDEEPYFHELVAGIERVLLPRQISVLVNVLPALDDEVKCYRRWTAAGDVQAVILVDLRPDDMRIREVRALGMPAIAIGDAASGGGLDTVWTQDDRAIRNAVQGLAEIGHNRIAHVSGPIDIAHTRIRNAAFEGECASRGVVSDWFEGDYSANSGRAAMIALAARDERPTAIVFDNDIMALGALATASELDIAVPGDVSLLAWDDSALCQLSAPSMAAMSHDVQRVGELAGRAILNVIDGGVPMVLTASPATLVLRETVSAPA